MSHALNFGLCSFWIALLALLFSSCSATKNVPEGDALFWNYNIDVKSDQKLEDKSALELELAGTVRPKPNAKVLGIPFKLWIHNFFGPTDKEKGFKYWLSYKLGQPPVLLSSVDTTSIQGVMRSRMHNRGYFENHVSSTTEVKNKKAEINFTTTLQQPYKIRKVVYPKADSLPIFDDLRKLQQYSFLKVGENYNLNAMMAERDRLNERLKNQGYYNFSPDMLIFRVDSTVETRQVDIFMQIKRDAPIAGLKKYFIDDIYIFTNYSLTDTLPAIDTIRIQEVNYIPNENYIRGKHIMRSVFLEKGQEFSNRNHTLTISRLMGMGAFSYANINYIADTLEPYKLDANIYLTQAMKKSLRLEAQAVTKTNNFAGPGLMASFRNRNAFKGSELLTVNLVTRYETQIGGARTGVESGAKLNSYEIGLNTELTFPRFVAPFKVRSIRSDFVPKTRINLGYTFLNRVEYFQMNNYNLSYGYTWRPKRTLTWEVTPINIQYVQLGKTTPAFEERLRLQPFLRRSFEQQYIFGSIYRLIYSNQMRHWKTSNIYNSISLDLSGNSINAIKTLLGDDKPTEDNPRTIAKNPKFANQPFSQYVRLENDFRYYLNFSKKSMLATRLITGAGIPVGNSTTMPYIKQFSIGGTNSIRAFRARSIGPGSYVNPEPTSFFDQTGDIKLETNIEYRFPLSGFFFGALFVDAGNIWLVEEDAIDRPGGEFKPNKILNELAVGTGFGLRIDVEFFVLRLDLGIPVRRPGKDGKSVNVLGDNWSISGDDSMVLNIGIGYPF